MKKLMTLLRFTGAYFMAMKISVNQLAGAEMNVMWFDEPNSAWNEHEEFVYASFGVDPVETSNFDEFGVPDDEIFYYFSGFMEVAGCIIRQHHDGWQIKDIRLVTV
jgi:hypothetical protein